MNRFLWTVSLVLLFLGAYAQSQEVHWSAELSQISEAEYELKIIGETTGDWVIYSQFIEEDGPLPTVFTVHYPSGAEALGKFAEPDHSIKKMDDMFGMVLTKFKGKTEFVQRIKSKEKLSEIEGEITFMTCDDSKCLPPRTVVFSASLQ